MTSILIGSVNSSQVVLEELIAAGCPPELVFALDEQYSRNVSGYAPIHHVAESYGIPYRTFKKISEPKHIAEIIQIQPDYIFVVGLSQLVGQSIIDAAKKGVVGLHPAPLPRFRGRAAMVWQMLLDVRESAVSLFLIDDGVDSGPILGQEPFSIGEDDYAADMERKCLKALRILCRRVFPAMQTGEIYPIPQCEENATYLLKRGIEDGVIDWNQSVRDIHRLIRAVSHPYPGAFSHYDGRQLVTFWRAEIESNPGFIGFPGQIARKDEHTFSVLCTDGLLHVTDYSCEEPIRLFVGHRFRFKGDVR